MIFVIVNTMESVVCHCKQNGECYLTLSLVFTISITLSLLFTMTNNIVNTRESVIFHCKTQGRVLFVIVNKRESVIEIVNTRESVICHCKHKRECYLSS